ncbi:GNAT superfamily N-acetyltransferase [Croceifilum oryzae]|uniref:GNAT superfamily N-acetyltransferase n=1 Tax=Croceifilum oryzae TaxID=1553429 RepID=A0AAJ1WS53_9BACL|nr:GNAT family N-acetyltransferase [Croceifilum oryzae]MDQ0416683.1 GNAT superfamily N-acetyltransferase [Croceifilum oryzae]
MKIRPVEKSDYYKVISVIDDWWGGRQVADMLPKLFFDHFKDTSFVIDEDHDVLAFLIGFISQSNPQEAYIHFVGVHPDYRKEGLAKKLYEEFFKIVKEKNCRMIHCVTSPINQVSIAFHHKMGFSMVEGNDTVQGVPVHKNYDGRGQDRVLFVKEFACDE